jgi:hypothetical protein
MLAEDSSTLPGGQIGTVLICLSVAIVASLLYGAVAPLLPFIVIKVTIAVFAIMAIYQCFAHASGSLPARILLALIGAAVAATALWFGWIWQEFGLSSAVEWALAGPQAAYATLAHIAPDYSYEFTRRGTSGGNGPFVTYLIWWGETLLFAAIPLMGAFTKNSAR